MLLASNIRLLLFLLPFGLFCRLENGIILYGFVKNIVLHLQIFNTQNYILLKKSIFNLKYSKNFANFSLDILIKYILMHHKNYIFLDCDWFKKTPIFHYSLANLSSDGLLLDSSISQSKSNL